MGAAAIQTAQTRKTKVAAILMVIGAEIGVKLPLVVKGRGGTIAHHPPLHLKQYTGARARGIGSFVERHPVHPLVIASTQATGRAVRIVKLKQGLAAAATITGGMIIAFQGN